MMTTEILSPKNPFRAYFDGDVDVMRDDDSQLLLNCEDSPSLEISYEEIENRGKQELGKKSRKLERRK